MSGRNRGGSNSKKTANNKTSGKRKKTNSKKKFDSAGFWGDPDALPDPDSFETSTPDPVAVVTSLGQPPLPGHGPASPHYFTLIYNRSAQLAGALAMAGELDDLTPEAPPEPEPEPEAGNAFNEDDTLADDDADGNEIAGNGATDTEDDELSEASADEDGDGDEPLGDEPSASEQE